MGFFLFIQPYPGDDWTDVAITTFFQEATYYKDPMNTRSKWQNCKKVGEPHDKLYFDCGWIIENSVPNRYASPN